MVVAALGTPFGLAAGLGKQERRACHYRGKVDDAKIDINEYVNAAFPRWVANHPDQVCPRGLADLNQYTNRRGSDISDAWGRDMIILDCGDAVPGHIRVFSLGEDGEPNTPDDIKSWE